MADNRTGKITQVIGAVLDIKFGSDNLQRSMMRSIFRQKTAGN